MLSMLHPMPMLLDEMMFGPLTAHTHPFLASNAARPTLSENDSSYVIAIAAPGVRSGDLKITVDHRSLKVVGETPSRGTMSTHVVNWTVNLPRDADADLATATHDDGVITVHLPKKQPSEPLTLLASTEVPEPCEGPHYSLTVSAPGLAAADLSISIDDEGAVKLTGSTERTGARIKRSFQLPEDAAIARAHASHVDGILTISVPKAKRAPEKHLELASTKPKQSHGQNQEATAAHQAAAGEAGKEEEEEGVMV